MGKIDIIIIGAGAAGLMAAHTLANKGRKVVVLEARDRCGGRIHTLTHGMFNTELGAEFIHGDLPVTIGLLKEANISYRPAGGEMLHYKDGTFSNEGEFKNWDTVVDRLGELKKDLSIANFLDEEFGGDKHNELRKAVIRFVSGYDTADPVKVSSFALRQEWRNENEDAQHRVEGGYGAMIKYLEEQITAGGGQIFLNTVAKKIKWERGKVNVLTANGDTYMAGSVIIALPLGVLQADESESGAIKFEPPIAEQTAAINAMGFGAIVKILMEFDEPFWEQPPNLSLRKMGFLLSDEEIPTWWTQLPNRSNLLTGWLGGPQAAAKTNTSDDDILQQALVSLSNIFKISVNKLRLKLIAFKIANWTADPFTHGSYAYDTLHAADSRQVLSEPIADTIYFAGEYLYDGPAMGTVEAALTSGEEVARRMTQPFEVVKTSKG